MNTTIENKWKNHILVILIATSLLSFFFVKPISQDLSYHLFADTRTLFRTTNFFDVTSNIPFFIVGIIGIKFTITNWFSKESWAWLILFSSIILVSLGSAYYHLNPNNQTLVWDRLPMAIAFMALFVLVIGDYVNSKLSNLLLLPLCLLGVFSVIYWSMTDDLRLYAWVQFISMGLLLLILFMYQPKTFQTKFLIYAFIFYTFSKITEHFDAEIFNYLQKIVSGHTIKHLFAAFSTYYFYLLMKTRKF